jgi:hypothetical protein
MTPFIARSALVPRLVAALLFAAACTHTDTDRKVVASPLPAEGKPMAPVGIDAQLTPGHARVLVHFETDAEATTITLSGVDGLKVVSSLAKAAASSQSAKRGETVTVDADLSGTTGILAVNVTGTFNGAIKSRVVSFTLGDAPVKPSPGEHVQTESGGLKVLPAAGH